MSALKLRRIDYGPNAAAAQITEAPRPVPPRREVVSPSSKKLTQSVFVEPLTPAQAVERICNDVHNRGCRPSCLHRAIRPGETEGRTGRVKPRNWPTPTPRPARVPRCDPPDPVQRAAIPVRVLHRDAEMRVSRQHELHCATGPSSGSAFSARRGGGLPLDAADTIVPRPGRRGWSRSSCCMPPRDRGVQPELLAVCHELGVTEVYRRRGAGDRRDGLRGGRPQAGGHDRRAGQPVRGPGQEARLRTGGHRLHRRPQRDRGAADDSAAPGVRRPRLIAQAEHSPGAPSGDLVRAAHDEVHD